MAAIVLAATVVVSAVLPSGKGESEGGGVRAVEMRKTKRVDDREGEKATKRRKRERAQKEGEKEKGRGETTRTKGWQRRRNDRV